MLRCLLSFRLDALCGQVPLRCLRRTDPGPSQRLGPVPGGPADRGAGRGRAGRWLPAGAQRPPSPRVRTVRRLPRPASWSTPTRHPRRKPWSSLPPFRRYAESSVLEGRYSTLADAASVPRLRAQTCRSAASFSIGEAELWSFRPGCGRMAEWTVFRQVPGRAGKASVAKAAQPDTEGIETSIQDIPGLYLVRPQSPARYRGH
jgi:hypothetical protein